MARFHLSCDATVAVAGRSDGDTPQRAGIQVYGPPEDDPELYVVVAAGKIALPPGTLYCRVEAVAGSIYIRSGAVDDTIAAPAGFLILEGREFTLPVAITGGRPDTHLHLIEANPTTDTAVDLNA